MKNYQIGMFVEQNKTRLLPNDLAQAKSLLENAPTSKVNRLLTIKTKSPTVATILAWLLGWCGADCFYLDLIKKGIGRIITTIIGLLLDIGTFLLFSLIAGDVAISNMPTIVDKKIVFDTIFINASILQYGALGIAILFAIIYVAKLIKNAITTETFTKLINKQLYNLRCVSIPKIEEYWNIG